jgi:hypothetical protein
MRQNRLKPLKFLETDRKNRVLVIFRHHWSSKVVIFHPVGWDEREAIGRLHFFIIHLSKNAESFGNKSYPNIGILSIPAFFAPPAPRTLGSSNAGTIFGKRRNRRATGFLKGSRSKPCLESLLSPAHT